MAKVTSFRDYGSIPLWCRKPHLLCITCVLRMSLRAPLFLLCALSGMGHRSFFHAVCATVGVWVESVLATSKSLIPEEKSLSCHTRMWRTMLCFQRGQQSELKTAWLTVDHHHEVNYKLVRDDRSTTRWCAAIWISILIEEHAWLSAGLIWKLNASDSGLRSNYADTKSDVLDSTVDPPLTSSSCGKKVHNYQSCDRT